MSLAQNSHQRNLLKLMLRTFSILSLLRTLLKDNIESSEVSFILENIPRNGLGFVVADDELSTWFVGNFPNIIYFKDNGSFGYIKHI